MKKLQAILPIVLLVAPLALGQSDSPKKIKVVATNPAIGSIAAQIGGDLVEVVSLCRPTDDVHTVDATPSLLTRLGNADVLAHTGLDLEMWLDDAVKSARNPKIAPGAPGNIDCSTGIELLEVPTNPSREDGDVHIYGNPHYWLDPQNGRKMAATIAAGLVAYDPSHKATYDKNRDAFDADMKKRLVEWLKKAIPYKNTPIIAYHNSFAYLVRRFGFQTVGFVEPKPRIPPTQAHLKSVIELIKSRGVKVVIREPYHDPAPTDFLAEQTGVKIATVTQLPGGIENTPTYQEMVGKDLDAILEKLK